MKCLVIIALLISGLQIYGKAKEKWYQWVPRDPQTLIVVYGCPGSWRTEDVRKGLDKCGIPYRFENVDSNRETAVKMWEVMSAAYDNHPSCVVLPVVEVHGEVLLSPDFIKVARIYGEEKWVWPDY